MPTTKKKPVAKKAKKTTAKKTAQKAVKKTAKKSAKKAATKATKKQAKALVCADGQECFWTTDGQVLKDLTELRDALDQMADEVFSYHVGKGKNDFADWVEGVLFDAECAAALRRSRKPASAKTVVVKHLKFYSL